MKDKLILDLIKKETVRQNVTNVPDTRSQTEKITTTDKYNKPYKDYYCLPFGNQIIKDYSNMNPVYSKTMGDWRTHNGIDFTGGTTITVSVNENVTLEALEKDFEEKEYSIKKSEVDDKNIKIEHIKKPFIKIEDDIIRHDSIKVGLEIMNILLK